MKQTFEDILKTIEKLRGKDGCPWDKEQTIKSLKKDILEEANEVAEAIDEGDNEHLKEELGDLIWSIALLVQVAKEEKLFDMKDVLVHAKNKLIRRHPHVFGNLKAKDSEEALKIWKKIKREEKSKRLG